MNETFSGGAKPLAEEEKGIGPKGRIVRNIRRPDAEAIRALSGLSAATVHEAQGRKNLMRPYLRPIYPNSKIVGPCVTVLCPPGDNLMIHAAIEVCKPGDVMVVSTTSDSTDGMFGDLLGLLCQTQGVIGLVIDAGVRDTTDLEAMNFPVWAKAVCAQGTVKASPGSVNVPMICAGVLVHPGDVIVADADGVTVVPLRQAALIARLGHQRMVMEEAARERFRSGELSVDFFGLRAKLKELGVEYVDRAQESDPY